MESGSGPLTSLLINAKRLFQILLRAKPTNSEFPRSTQLGLESHLILLPPIIAKARNKPPIIDRSSLVEVRIKAGQSFTFDCKVSGEPAPQTKWLLKKKEVYSKDNVKVTNVDYNTKLKVNSATRSDSGIYTVFAEKRKRRRQCRC